MLDERFLNFDTNIMQCSTVNNILTLLNSVNTHDSKEVSHAIAILNKERTKAMLSLEKRTKRKGRPMKSTKMTRMQEESFNDISMRGDIPDILDD
jgi:tRNA(Ser,Leu) C12 N-acetylase TAN1